MPVIFRDDIGPYTGKGSPLTKGEVDGNFYDLLTRALTLEGDAGKQIEEITSSGTALTVHYTDATTDGPFPMPVAQLHPAGDWANDTPYSYGDLVTVHRQGTYLVLVDHITPPAPAVFDPEATDESTDLNLLYYQMTPGVDTAHDLAFSIIGQLPAETTAGVLAGQFIVSRSFTVDGEFVGSYAWLDTASATTDGVLLDIEKNGAIVGSITFAPATNAGEFAGVSTDPEVIAFVPGDRVGLRLVTSDLDASDLAVTLAGFRSDI